MVSQSGSDNLALPVVGHFHPAYLALSEVFIHRMLAGLREFRPVVFTQTRQNDDVYHFNNHYQVIEIGSQFSFADRALAKVVREFRLSSNGYDSRAARYSAKILKIRPRLLHAHFGNVGWECLPLKRVHGLPMVVSFHGADATALSSEHIWQKRFAELFRYADAITAPSEFIAGRLAQQGCPADKIKVIHYGIPISTWAKGASKSDARRNSTDILMVARFVEKKGIPIAIEALKRVVEVHPSARLRLIGDGPLRGEIERTISNEGLENHVDLLGFVSNNEVEQFMERSAVLIAPSVTGSDGDMEGLPVSLLEACAAELPVIASRHSGIPELVEDGKSGYLIPENDAQALVDKLLVLLGDPDLRIRLGREGRKIVERKFDLNNSTRELEELYRSVVTSSSKSPAVKPYRQRRIE